MIFALMGGDGRFVRLCALLRADGHTVCPFALEKALPDCAGSSGEAAEGADCAVLPLPCLRGGALNAPYAESAPAPEELLSVLMPGTPVCAGNAPESLGAFCGARGLPLLDYGRREDFALRNAELTAEGALPLLLDGPRALRGSRVLVAGYGRIGRALSRKLLALGAGVTVCARSAEARTAAELDGCAALPLEEAPGPGYDAVVNTVPATVFSGAALDAFGAETKLLELASPPYGFDFAAAEARGRNIILAPGLPGKTAPETAAEALRDTIYAILKERT